MLPKETPRSKPGGYSLVKSLRTGPILSGALDGVWDQVDRRVIQMGPVNGITVNKSYDAIALPGVPFKGDHVDLQKPETLRSNANGFAAATWLSPFNSRTATKEASRLKEIEARVIEGLTELLDGAEYRRLYDGEKVPVQEVLKGGGPIPPPKRRKIEPTPITELPHGLQAGFFEFLPAALALHGTGKTPAQPDLAKRLMYKLLIQQNGFGRWGSGGQRRWTLTSSLAELRIHKGMESLVTAAKKPVKKKNDKERIPTYGQYVYRFSNIVCHDQPYQSALALVYLGELLPMPVALEEERIQATIDELMKMQQAAQEAAAAEAEAAAAEGEAEGAKKSNPKPPQLPAHTAKTNDALVALWGEMMSKLGKDLPVPPEEQAVADVEEAGTEEGGEAAEAPADEAPAAKAEEDVPDAGALLDDIMK